MKGIHISETDLRSSRILKPFPDLDHPKEQDMVWCHEFQSNWQSEKWVNGYRWEKASKEGKVFAYVVDDASLQPNPNHHLNKKTLPPVLTSTQTISIFEMYEYKNGAWNKVF